MRVAEAPRVMSCVTSMSTRSPRTGKLLMTVMCFAPVRECGARKSYHPGAGATQTFACKTPGSAKRLDGGRLLRADLAGLDVGNEEVFAADGTAGQTAHHGYLADVGQGISDRTLKERFESGIQRLIG